MGLLPFNCININSNINKAFSLVIVAILNCPASSASSSSASSSNDDQGRGHGGSIYLGLASLSLPSSSWYFMASSLFLAVLLSWWIGTTLFSTSSSLTTSASSLPSGSGSASAVSDTASGGGNFSSVEAFKSVVHRRIIRPASDRILKPWTSSSSSSASSLNVVEDQNSEKEDEQNTLRDGKKNKNSSNNTNNKAAASAVASSFDNFFSNSSAITADLEPPFSAMLEEYNVSPEELTSVVPHPDVTHFCFLIHGHRGLSKDLAYFQTVMQREAAIEKKRNGLMVHDDDQDDGVLVDIENDFDHVEVNDDNCESETKCAATPSKEKADLTTSAAATGPRKSVHESNKRHDMVIYSSVANEGKTTDGIDKGGDRLVEELRTVIDNEMKKRYPEILGNEIMEDNTGSTASSNDDDKIYDVTISMLGNSLGGLFGRYAIAKLVERHCVREVRTIKVKGVQNDKFSSIRAKIKKSPMNDDEDVLEEECWILDGKYRLHLNIFCTTATPHLGVSGHTWFRIPRTAEIGVAHAMGNTGKDLFRLNDLLHKMATDPLFLRPLGAFRKRIAYANCYGTDFVVPAGTAAFLSENSTYPHHFSDDYILDENGLVIAALHTPTHTGGEDEEAEEHSDELHEMSSSLDKLGWKKVFVDVRKEMPSVEIPKVLRRSSTPGSETSDDDKCGENNDAVSSVTNKVEELKKQKVVQSKDIADAVSSSIDNRVSLPLGHNMIVAFSRNRVFTYANKGGRPIVDSLAKELVEDIFKWDDIYDGPVLSTSLSSLNLATTLKRQQKQKSQQDEQGSASTAPPTKMARRVSADAVAMEEDSGHATSL